MSSFHLAWLSTGSTEMPMILAPRLANSPDSPAMVPSSVVHTGVKFLGWLNSTAQPSPIHSWKLIVPCVVSAVKSGAISLMRRPMAFSPDRFAADGGHHNPIHAADENGMVEYAETAK